MTCHVGVADNGMAQWKVTSTADESSSWEGLLLKGERREGDRMRDRKRMRERGCAVSLSRGEERGERVFFPHNWALR